jgi:hypothetical protein
MYAIDEEAIIVDEKEKYLPRFYRAKSCLVNYWFLFRMCLTSDPKFKKHLKKSAEERENAKAINSVSRVDRVSRIIFPILFLILNIIYWHSHYSQN